MPIQTWLMFGTFVISSTLAAFNIWQMLRKRKQEDREVANRATTVFAERDSIMVKGAEGVLLMMEKTLAILEREKATAEQERNDAEQRERDCISRLRAIERGA